jgi:zinc transport system substrate-binding protein
MNRLFLLLSVILIALMQSCTGALKNGKPMITVSILPQKYFVERIAGERFNIYVLTPPGASPETYEPTPKQMKTLGKSVLYFSNGYLMFEDRIADKLGRDFALRTIELSRGIDLIAGDIVDHGDHVHLYGIDPHYWLSITEVRIQARNILDALLSVDPEHSGEYEANFSAFMSDIDKLDEHIRELLSQTLTRTFLIYHPALAYFAREYALEQIALETDGKEPTASHLKYIIDLARENQINTILIQSQFNMTAAEAVAREINGRVVLVDPLPEDWLQNMYELAHVIHQALNP